MAKIESEFYDGKRVQKALRLAFHSDTPPVEKLAALESVRRLDPETKFIETLDPKYSRLPEFHPTRVWRERLAEKERMIDDLRKQLRRRKPRVQVAAVAQEDGGITTLDQVVKKAALIYPVRHTKLLACRFGNRTWKGDWNEVRREIIGYLLSSQFPLSEINIPFKTVYEGLQGPADDPTPGERSHGKPDYSPIPHMNHCVKTESAESIMKELQAASDHFKKTLVLIIRWPDQKITRKTKKGIYKVPSAFPGFIGVLKLNDPIKLDLDSLLAITGKDLSY